MIEVRGLSKRYGELTALTDISLKVEPGEMLVVLGPSGAGKSTLLRCVNRLVEPSSGEVRIAGDPPAGGGAALRRLRSQVGMIFQDHNLVPRLSVLKNVLTGRLARMPAWMSLLQLFRDEDLRIALDCLKRVELDDRAWSRADRLSGGQQQRVGIARAIVTDPTILLCDEPTGDLDRKSGDEILSLLQALNREQGKTIVMVTHDPHASARATRTVYLDKGQLSTTKPE